MLMGSIAYLYMHVHNNAYMQCTPTYVVYSSRGDCAKTNTYVVGKYECITWTDNMLWPGGHCGLGRCFIHESQDLSYVGRHDESNTYLSLMRSVSFLDFHQTYTHIQVVNLVRSITLQDSSFFVRSHRFI